MSTMREPEEWTAPLLYWVHREIFGHHFPELAGRNRTGEALFGKHGAAPPGQVDALMGQLILAQREHLAEILAMGEFELERLDKTFLFAAMDHGEMIKIHPFVDGNGRWARVVTNAFLRDAELPAATIIRKADKAAYIAALDRCIERGAAGDLANQLAEGYIRELERRWP